MQKTDVILDWLLQGDPSIRWQTLRDLCAADENTISSERKKVSVEGWGARLLSYQEPSGQWGEGLYSPKWISTTYTMLLLRRLGLATDDPQARKACHLLLDKGFYHDGGINFFNSMKHSETCITGMILSILAYFEFKGERVAQIAGHLLAQQMPDGGWNCRSYTGATHSSFHTTISALEGLREYEKFNPPNLGIVRECQKRGREFLLIHELFRSHRTGEVFDPKMTRFSFPPRWRYDLMRTLDYFQECDAERGDRMADAIELLKKKQGKDGRWVLQNRHPGKTFFEMEQVGKPSRWNTLRALRIFQWLEP